tara:strand:+ start:154 stop:357 length:204 start_codon:yes stop_codon:yes gene_type:complete
MTTTNANQSQQPLTAEEREAIIADISDTHKDVRGFRPTYSVLKAMSDADLLDREAKISNELRALLAR